jgi:hypothetical protein
MWLSVSVALFRQVTLPRMLSDAVPYGVRTFLDSDKQNRDCPTDLRLFYHTRKGGASQLFASRQGNTSVTEDCGMEIR